MQWMSVDPYMRGTMNDIPSYGNSSPFPRSMKGGAIGTIIKTNHTNFKIGEIVEGKSLGWRDYAISDGTGIKKIQNPENFPLSYFLGCMGMPGATAYFGLIEICNPKKGETVVVSTATGAVGAIVRQIAKIIGCKVIGIAGGEDKCNFAKKIGYDECINYFGKNIHQLSLELKKFSPSGIDCYFDNTGGDITEAVFENLNNFARVSVCGQISYYNSDKKPLSFPMGLYILRKQLKVEGWLVGSKWKDWTPAHKNIGNWIKEGKLIVKEDIWDGLENAFPAFLSLFRRESGTVNFGKVVIKIND